MKQKDSEIAALQRQNKALAANFDTITGSMPKVEDVKRLTKTFSGAERTISLVNVASWCNSVVVAIFVAIVLFGAWQAYEIKQDVKTASYGVQSVREAVYNHDGWSVLNGTISNEQEWAKRNPEAYQRYLEQKEQRQNGLK